MAITNMAQAQSRNLVIRDLMVQTGWPKSRAKLALRELEQNALVIFPADGGMALQIGKQVI